MPLSISLEKQRGAFQKHLDALHNQRIIFSGAFGIGKTYFLNDYFSAEHGGKYVAVKLSPVNYSVSSNEDIFQLIKYDILFELIASERLVLNGATISRWVAYGVTLQNKLPAILNGFMNVLPLLNKDTGAITAVWSAITAALPFIKETEAARKDPELYSRLDDFGKQMKQLAVLESDYVTSFIENNLNDLAATEGEAKTKVLIIDDLDRIDPEHIFRLFNIFSAHFDYHKDTDNKFGFNKVVFVCDIRNIRNMFHSRYGAATDFTGYIDKFYSHDIYYFDNSEEVQAVVHEYILGIQHTERFRSYFFNHIAAERKGNSLLSITLTELIYAGALSMRRIVTTYESYFPYEETSIGFRIPYEKSKNWMVPAIVVLQTLNWIMGGADALDGALERLIRYQRSQEYLDRNHREQEYFVSTLLPVLDHEQHKFNTHELYGPSKDKEAYVYVNPITAQKLSYWLNRTDERRDYNVFTSRIELVNGEKYNDQELGLFSLLHQAFKILQKQGILR